MAKVAGKKCVAKFVESEEVLAMLRDLGMDYAQGCAIGRPQPFERAYPVVDLPLAVA